MATKKIYFGSVGPFLYDDTDPVNDPDGDFAGESHKALVTDGQQLIGEAPVDPTHVVRLQDLTGYILPLSVANIDDPSAELNAIAGDHKGSLALCYQTLAGDDEWTLYAWDDASTDAENVPYTVDGLTGMWIAIAGKYASATSIIGSLTASRLVATSAAKALVSVANLQSWIAGVANQIVTANDGDGTITLSTPQNIHDGASPTFVTVKLSDLTDGYIPYHVADATGLADGPIFTDGADTYFATAGHGWPYGEIYYMDVGADTAVDAQDTYVQFLGFDTDGLSNLATPDHTNDHITIVKTGVYFISFSVGARSANANVYYFQVKKNNGTVDITNIMVHRTTSVADRLASGACSGIASLTAGDTIELWMQRTDGGAVARTLTLEHVTLSLFMIGG